MGKEKIFEYESIQDTETLAEYLYALADGFKKGRLEFSRSGETVELNPRGLLEFYLEAKADGKARKLKFKLGWKEEPIPRNAETEPLLIKAGDRDS